MKKEIETTKNNTKDKVIKPINGGVVLALIIILFVSSITWFIFSIINLENGTTSGFQAIAQIIISALCFGLVVPILSCGLKVINPNEALVLTLFGKYYGTIINEGFFFVNPFCVGTDPTVYFEQNKIVAYKSYMGGKKISLKATTLNNEKQKVNDQDGNPIEIGVIVIWKVVDAASAVFNVDNYKTFVSTQCDSVIRNVVRCYPYDVSSKGDEHSLRGSSTEISEVLKKELQSQTEIAGIEIIEAKISHLAYAPEIAAAMLQRQQASAVIAARQKIVEGAVGMVEMALNKISENGIATLDEERKAAMISNLLVVLCGNKDAQPVVNSGSIY